jgi:hypothetical protein
MSRWTPKLVWSELMSAAATADKVAGAEVALPDIARMQRARGWLSVLEPEDRDLVWARARRTRWKQICWSHRISRPTAHRRRQRALDTIVAHLRVQKA